MGDALNPLRKNISCVRIALIGFGNVGQVMWDWWDSPCNPSQTIADVILCQTKIPKNIHKHQETTENQTKSNISNIF